jgi:micrococcal nuclease
MTFKRLRPQNLIFLLIMALIIFIFDEIEPAPEPSSGSVLSETVAALTPAYVSAITDGDTFKIQLEGETQTVRIIGIDTPETVAPRKAVECFGKEASNRLRDIILHQTVYLDSDDSQSNRDRYNRLLRYVFLADGTDVGFLMIQEGFALEYTYRTPHRYQSEYRLAQEDARNNALGLWGPTCNP